MNKELPVNLDKQAAHRDAVSRYFSTKTDFWETVYTEKNGACSNYMGFHMRRRRDVVLDCLRTCLASGGTVLDVGCGAGQLACFLRDNGLQNYHGLDFSIKRIEHARIICPEFSFSHEDAYTSQLFSDVDYDTVIFTFGSPPTPYAASLVAGRETGRSAISGVTVFVTIGPITADVAVQPRTTCLPIDALTAWT